MLSIIVDTLVDENDGIGIGTGTSLRDAIAAATPGETIDFSVTGTINMNDALGEMLINKALTIIGPGANLLTIDAGNGADHTFATGDGYRIFNIDDGSGALIDVEIIGLTLTGGDAPRGADGNEATGSPGASGGAILSTENLTVIASTISGNASGSGGTGGFAFGGGTLSFAYAGGAGGSGGGIFSSAGTLTIRDSTIDGNMTGRGGNAGTPVASADFRRGANGGDGGDGGGIFVASGNVLIEQSTISGDATGSGGNASSGNFGSGTPGVRGDGGGVASSASTMVTRSTLLPIASAHDVDRTDAAPQIVGDRGLGASGRAHQNDRGVAEQGLVRRREPQIVQSFPLFVRQFPTRHGALRETATTPKTANPRSLPQNNPPLKFQCGTT